MVEIRELPEARSEERFFRCALAVTLRRRGTDLHLLTSDVSFQGAFIRTDDAPPSNSLVRVLFTLPPDQASLALSAHVVAVVKPGDAKDQYAGFHARFVALNGPVKDRWESLVWSLKREHKQSVHTTVNFARPSYVNLVQQKVTEATSVRVYPASVDALARFIKEDVPQGTVFLPAPSGKLPPPGAKVSLEVVHPITGGIAVLSGVVRRRGGVGHDPQHAADGVMVTLSVLNDEAHAGLAELLESVVVFPDYDVELFDQPSLRPGSLP